MAEQKTLQGVRSQLGACLTSDLDDAAKVLWVYLYACKGGGAGTKSLAKTLQLSDKMAESAIEILRERGVIRRENGTWRANVFELPDMIATPEQQAAAASPQQGAAIAILTHYNECRVGAGFGPLLDERSALVSFRKLALWLSEHGVHFDQFLTWAREKISYNPNIAFPAPQLLAGPYLAGEWVNAISRRESAPARGGHAGRSYRDVAALRERLVGAGFSDAASFGRAELRYVLEAAENMIALPEHCDAPEEQYREVVAWLVSKLEAEDAPRSRR